MNIFGFGVSKFKDMTLKDLHTKVSLLDDTNNMPVVFVGHGNPMNAIEQNEFTDAWSNINKSVPQPSAIVCISAHWETRGTYVTTNEFPKTIHDFYGFPRELFRQEYPAPGSPDLAQRLINEVKHTSIENSFDWGLDHGTWSVLKHIYPNANIPVIQISIDRYKDARWHHQLGLELSFLRSKGVLVIGSGNMVHNLGIMNVKDNDFNAEFGYDWAFELNDVFKKKIINNEVDDLIHYQRLHKDAKLAIPTPEHYIPLLYILGMRKENENVTVFNDKVIAGSLSMTSVIIGSK